MYPYFSIPLLDVRIYSFGLGLAISFVLFFYMLLKLSKKMGINTNFFLWNALLFVGSTFIFSRLFFVFLEWRDYKYIVGDQVLNFFLMDNYNLSFIGGVIGFIGVLAYKIYRYEQPKEKYIDIVVLSFLFAAVVGYLAAFVGGQIYGRPTLLPIGIIYGNESAIPYTSSILPLALFYSLGCFFLFSTLYILREIIRIPGYIGYIGIALYSCFLFIGEFFTGSDDLVRSLIFINASQIWALLGLGFAVYGLLQISKRSH